MLPPQSQHPTAPRDYLQFFLSALSQQQADALLFTDATGFHPLFIAGSQEAALRFIQRDPAQTPAAQLNIDGRDTPSVVSRQSSPPQSTIIPETGSIPSKHDNVLDEQESTPAAKRPRLEGYVPPSPPGPGLQVTNRNPDMLAAQAKQDHVSCSLASPSSPLHLLRA